MATLHERIRQVSAADFDHDLDLDLLPEHPGYRHWARCREMIQAAAVALRHHSTGVKVHVRAVFVTQAEARPVLRWTPVPQQVESLQQNRERRTEAAAEGTGLLLALHTWDAVAVEESAKFNGWDYRLVCRRSPNDLFQTGPGDMVVLELSGIDAQSRPGAGSARIGNKRKRLQRYPDSPPALVIVTSFLEPQILVEYVAPR